MEYRSKLKSSDVPLLSEILISTGFFYDSEVEIALELAQENINKGEEKSGYIFIVAEENAKPIAFSCYGKIPGTESSFDLYWIVVHKSQRRNGIGRIMMNRVVEDVRQRNGRSLWIETSSRPLYEPTRRFYLSYGCEKVAELPEFYGKNDSKIIYRKIIS